MESLWHEFSMLCVHIVLIVILATILLRKGHVFLACLSGAFCALGVDWGKSPSIHLVWLGMHIVSIVISMAIS